MGQGYDTNIENIHVDLWKKEIHKDKVRKNFMGNPKRERDTQRKSLRQRGHTGKLGETGKGGKRGAPTFVTHLTSPYPVPDQGRGL